MATTGEQVSAEAGLGRPLGELWRSSVGAWVLLAVSAGLVGFAFWESLVELEHIWSSSEEYSHGYFIPLISLFLVWQQRDELARLPFAGSWLGVAVLVAGVLIYVVGALSTIWAIQHYALIVVIAGFALAVTGWAGIRLLWPALLVLVFMIPLPQFVYQQLSQKLQLLSSEIGVAFIRVIGVPVHLEGNVIDLGVYKLQVVEACNGLRYLFPLMSFGFLAAYFFHAPLWQRLVVFLSTIPITVLMNSFRIGVIGVLVDRYGTEQAEGFLHDFEGWVIFMACVGILLIEMWLLMRLTGDRRPFREAFGIDLPEGPVASASARVRPVSRTLVASVVLLALGATGSYAIGQRQEAPVARQEFLDFPAKLGEWKGTRDTLEPNIVEALDVNDYIITDYEAPAGDHVNFYVAWYDSQRAGGKAHSPRACIPAGGWEIADLSQRVLPDVEVNGQPLEVNRVEIAKGDYRQVVYYWFQQRGRMLTSEYAMKWFLFWDALTRNRTDGALVRLTTMLRPGEDTAKADTRLTAFARQVEGTLTAYVPN
jgi:exosortase D (VPLPA-CTERM-specific)